MEWFYFSPAFAPLLCYVKSSSQLGSRSLKATLGRYHNSQVISHSLNAGPLKIPISLSPSFFFFYKTSPPIEHFREDVSCLSTLPTHSSPGNSGGLVGQLLDIFPLSLSCVLRQEEKEKKTVVSYLTGVVNVLLVDGCGSPRLSLSSIAMWPFSQGMLMSLLEGSVGASLLHSLLNLRPFTWLAVLS